MNIFKSMNKLLDFPSFIDVVIIFSLVMFLPLYQTKLTLMTVFGIAVLRILVSVAVSKGQIYVVRKKLYINIITVALASAFLFIYYPDITKFQLVFCSYASFSLALESSLLAVGIKLEQQNARKKS